MRQYAVLPHDYLEEMAALSDEEFGKLCRHLIRYTKDGTPIPEDGNLKFVALAVMNKADRYTESFEKFDNRNKGGAPKGNQNARKQPKTTETTGCFKNNQNNQNKQTETETDINISTKVDKAPTVKAQEVIDAWNEICTDLPKVKMATDTRVRAIKSRLKETTMDDLRAVFYLVKQSEFLNGKNDRGWTADFDWVMKPANFTKILEGNYSNKKPAGKTIAFNDIKKEDRNFAEDELVMMGYGGI